MNKLTTIIGVLFLIIISCSENETKEPTNENKNPLIKTIKEISSTNGLSTSFTYDGFKIKEATTTGLNVGQFKIIYTYTGDLITQEDGYINDILYVSTEYTYENNRLKTTIFKDTNSGTISPPMNQTKLVYNYLSGNIVDIDIYTYSNVWQLHYSFPKVKVHFNGGNILKREKFNSEGALISTINYEYDNSPNIYKNIIGFDKLFFINSFENNFNRHFDIKDISNTNNIKRIPSENEYYGYNYNLDGYPKEKLNYYNYGLGQYIIEKGYTYY
ncbi:hypothetical protein ACFX5D_12850 [Flavobacterium sp. LB3P45]|uniref:YD repeat-containing protein n=1 Tax=Flavobacterium fructosi TaxID=3230416 RepID=A0ABW6HP72_9FLAO